MGKATMKLYNCETLNPRKACAAARFLQADVEFVRVDLASGEQRTAEFLALNPNGKVPVLQEEARNFMGSERHHVQAVRHSRVGFLAA
ncbi:glutathione S-transferase [Rhizobium sp. BK049]|nr:glutathione S-transferase [Rhizobium sp. BK049]